MAVMFVAAAAAPTALSWLRRSNLMFLVSLGCWPFPYPHQVVVVGLNFPEVLQGEVPQLAGMC